MMLYVHAHNNSESIYKQTHNIANYVQMNARAVFNVADIAWPGVIIAVYKQCTHYGIKVHDGD